jgi:hypothetical protein
MTAPCATDCCSRAWHPILKLLAAAGDRDCRGLSLVDQWRDPTWPEGRITRLGQVSGPAKIRVEAANSGSWKPLVFLSGLLRLPRSTSSRNRAPKNNFRDHVRQRTTGRQINFRDYEQDHLSDDGRLPQQPRAGPGRLTSGPIPSPNAFPQLSDAQDRLIAAITGISAAPDKQESLSHYLHQDSVIPSILDPILARQSNPLTSNDVAITRIWSLPVLGITAAADGLTQKVPNHPAAQDAIH